MRLFQINELKDDEKNKIKAYLEKITAKSDLDTLFWLEIPEEFLDDEQKNHKECMPFCFAIEIGNWDFVNFEFLVRSRNKIRCSCIKFANKQQREFLFDFIDKLTNDLSIKV